MRVFYNILLSVFFTLCAPYYWLRTRGRGNLQTGFRQRFGIYDSKLKQALTNRDAIWIHATGVGEVNLCTQIIHALEPRVPNLKIVVSTSSAAGMRVLLSKLPSRVSKIYYPFDRRSYVTRAFSVIQPMVVVLLGDEVRPNFLWRGQSLGIPVFLVKPRFSQKSNRIYKRFRFLYRPLFASLAGVGAQDAAEAQGLRALGCRPEVIQIVGSLRFDAARLDERPRLDVPTLMAQMGLSPGVALLVGGMTAPGEAVLLAEQYLRLRARFPNLFLVLAPSHLDRSRELGRELRGRSLRPVFRNEITNHTQFQPGEVDCLVVNTPGELGYFYEQATVIFLGESLTTERGQDPIKPEALGKAMVFAPGTQAVAGLAASFLARDGAVQARDAEELERVLADLLANEARRRELGRNALEVARQNQGAIDRTVEMIIAKLQGQELYIKSPRTELPRRPPHG